MIININQIVTISTQGDNRDELPKIILSMSNGQYKISHYNTEELMNEQLDILKEAIECGHQFITWELGKFSLNHKKLPF